MEDADNILVARYRAGDDGAFETIVRRYLQSVYHYALRFTRNIAGAEDVAQETFVKAWRRLATFDETQKFNAWLFGIAKHAALDYLKKKSPIAFSDIENSDGENGIAETLRDDAPLPDAAAINRERAAMLTEGIATLDVAKRNVIRLHNGEGRTFSEIARMLKKPLHTVKSWHKRAFQKLRRVLRP